MGIQPLRTLPGGNGENAVLGVYEKSWRLHHPEFANRTFIRIEQTSDVGDWADPNHATKTLGVLLSQAQGPPVSDPHSTCTGLVPAAQVTLVSCQSQRYADPYPNPETLRLAVENLPGGSVLVIEVEFSDDGTPLESDNEFWDCIREATDKGIIVVEAAGNRAAYWEANNTSRDHNSSAKRYDSGAILVGAAQPSASGIVRHDTSRFGPQIRCYAQGHQVRTTSFSEVLVNSSYELIPAYACYSQTSAATAVLAGCAALLQSVLLAHGKPPLSPWRLRELLSTSPRTQPERHPDWPEYFRASVFPWHRELRGAYPGCIPDLSHIIFGNTHLIMIPPRPHNIDFHRLLDGAPEFHFLKPAWWDSVHPA